MNGLYHIPEKPTYLAGAKIRCFIEIIMYYDTF